MRGQAPVRGRKGRAPVLWVAVAVIVVGAGLLGAWLLGAGRDAGAQGAVTYELRGQGAEPVTVEVEVAATPEERRVGLSNRASVPEGTGMVFLFPGDGDGAFWMKDTLVPLSIAYVAAGGEVVSVHEMTPCEADPCPVYEPDGPYRYALELPAGAFDAAGVGPGDTVAPLDPEALPDPR